MEASKWPKAGRFPLQEDVPHFTVGGQQIQKHSHPLQSWEMTDTEQPLQHHYTALFFLVFVQGTHDTHDLTILATREWNGWRKVVFDIYELTWLSQRRWKHLLLRCPLCPLQWCVGGGGGAGGGGPWSIKSAPSAIPFDTQATWMSQGATLIHEQKHTLIGLI